MGPLFYGHLDAYKNLKLIANMKGLSLDTERLNEYLSMVGLKDVILKGETTRTEAVVKLVKKVK